VPKIIEIRKCLFKLQLKMSGCFLRHSVDEFGAKRDDNVFVTDNAANMKAAFHEHLWIGCSCHNLNLVLSHGLQNSKKLSDDSVPSCPVEVVNLIDSCKELVTLAKRTSINQALDKTLKQCVPTRWNSVLVTLKSVAENLGDLRSMSIDPKCNKNFLRLLADINDTLLESLIAVLEPFNSATCCLSAEKKSTLHLVAAAKLRLATHLTTCVNDCEVYLKSKLDQYFVVSDLHCIATMLDP